MNFFHSQAFAFILGAIIGGCFGVVIAAILAASGRASRMEEKNEENFQNLRAYIEALGNLFQAVEKGRKTVEELAGCLKKEKMRGGGLETKILTQDKPEDD